MDVLIALAISISIASTAAAWADVAQPKGNVVVAKTTPDALLIWDASPVVADIVGQAMDESVAMQLLEEDGIAILRLKANALMSSDFELRVVYTRSGAVSPVYGTPTFAGIERVLALKATRQDIIAHGAAWQQAAQHGAPTPGLSVSVTGKLPPSSQP